MSTEHLGGTFFLKKDGSTFNLEKTTENQTATFVFPAVDFSQHGSYFCEYEKKIPNQVIKYPQGVVAKLSGMIRVLSICSNIKAGNLINFAIMTLVCFCSNTGAPSDVLVYSLWDGGLQPRKNISETRQLHLCNMLHCFQVPWQFLLPNRNKQECQQSTTGVQHLCIFWVKV